MKHEISMLFLQNYWWCVLSLLTGVVVQMLYIFGGQVLSYQVGKTSMEREMTISVLGHKWGLTLASIATWVAVVWAVFPLMYAVTFSGAHAIWVLILLSYVVTICAYEFRNKSSFIEKGGNPYEEASRSRRRARAGYEPGDRRVRGRLSDQGHQRDLPLGRRRRH